MKRKCLLFLILLQLLHFSILAQEAIIPSGFKHLSPSGSYSATVGQIVYTTITDTSGSVSQGVQQPYEIYIVDDLEFIDSIPIACNVFPNPVVNALNLDINYIDFSGAELILTDNTGKIILNQKLENSNSQIDMSSYTSGIYFLKVIIDEKVKVFKIVKNK